MGLVPLIPGEPRRSAMLRTGRVAPSTGARPSWRLLTDHEGAHPSDPARQPSPSQRCAAPFRSPSEPDPHPACSRTIATTLSAMVARWSRFEARCQSATVGRCSVPAFIPSHSGQGAVVVIQDDRKQRSLASSARLLCLSSASPLPWLSRESFRVRASRCSLTV